MTDTLAYIFLTLVLLGFIVLVVWGVSIMDVTS